MELHYNYQECLTRIHTAMNKNPSLTITSRCATAGRALILSLVLALSMPTVADELATDQVAINNLLDGLHNDAAQARFLNYFARYTADAVFLGTDRNERWTIPEFKAYARPVFDEGRGWTYHMVERNIEGKGEIRWFDEVLHNEKLGHCRGTGVVLRTPEGWRIAHYALTMLVPNSIAAEVGNQTQAADNISTVP